MKKKEQTGLNYTNGTPICEGDHVIFWHQQESSPKLAPFERQIIWSPIWAAYRTSYGDTGEWGSYLADDVYDPNCRKITKKE